MSCWKCGADGSMRSRSLCNANSASAFQGGAKACTSTGFMPPPGAPFTPPPAPLPLPPPSPPPPPPGDGSPCRTGLVAMSGMPCIEPNPSFRPSCPVGRRSKEIAIEKREKNEHTQLCTSIKTIVRITTSHRFYCLYNTSMSNRIRRKREIV